MIRRAAGTALVGLSLLILTGVAGAQTADEREPGPAGGAGEVTDDPAAAGAAVRPGGGTRIRVGTVDRIGRWLGDDRPSTTVHRPGAQYVKVHLSRPRLLPGGWITVANPAGTEVHRYRSGDLAGPGRWTMSVGGDRAVVRVNGGSVLVDRVARGLTAAERRRAEVGLRATGARRPGTTGREESICGTDDKADAACYRATEPTAYRHAKAVVRLLINGSELCTGWRLGPANRVVTNHHCFADARSARNTEVWFNYQCAECQGYRVHPPVKVWGQHVLFTDQALDLTVFTVTGFADVRRFGYLEFDPTRPAAGDPVYIPQHPAGDPTRIAMRSDQDRAGWCMVADPATDGYVKNSDVSYYCDTEGGSSGSPVLSKRTGKVIALHHFGGCPNTGVRADLILRRLKGLG